MPTLERLLLAAIKNWLKDQAKATEVGKLRRRLENVLGDDPRFVRSRPHKTAGPDRTCLKAWQGDIDRTARGRAPRARGPDHPLEHLRPDAQEDQGRAHRG